MPWRRVACAFGLAVAATGCQNLLGLQEISVTGDGGSGTNPNAPPCSAAQFIDTFSAQTPCAPGASPWPSVAQVTQSDGNVTIKPDAVANGAAGCTTDQMLEGGAGGVEVRLVRPLDGADAYAGLQLAGPGVAIGLINGMIELTDLATTTKYGAVPYTANHTVWFRIRPDSSNGLIGDYYDGTSWHDVGTAPVQNAPGMISIESSLYQNTSYSGATVFAQLRVCE